MVVLLFNLKKMVSYYLKISIKLEELYKCSYLYISDHIPHALKVFDA